MSFKMHLIARVPNEGARRLAWWLATRAAPERVLFTMTVVRSISAPVALLSAQAGLDETAIDRLLRGELVPGAEMARRISVATAGVVLTAMWRDPPRGGWADRPDSGFGPEPMMFSRRRRSVLPNLGYAPGGRVSWRSDRDTQAEARA